MAVTDTLPAGSVVLESGIQGNHSRYELGQGTITFFFDRDDVRVVYPVVGAYLGDYGRALLKRQDAAHTWSYMGVPQCLLFDLRNTGVQVRPGSDPPGGAVTASRPRRQR